jgi:hypothetical protein
MNSDSSEDDLRVENVPTWDHSYCSPFVEEALVHAACTLVPDSLPTASNSAPASTSTAISTLDIGLSSAKKYLSNSLKPSTRSQYSRVYSVWQEFCKDNNLPEFDAGHEALASCLSLVMDQTKSFSAVSMLSAAIANEHRIHLKPSPTSHECISKLFKGFKLATQTSRSPVQPLTDQIIRQMIDKVLHPSHGRDGLKAPLVLWRTVWRAMMEFHTLGRFSDIVRLQRIDVSFRDLPSPHLSVLFKDGKNDQYSEGAECIVPAFPEEERYCPVNFTKKYFQFLGTGFTGFLVPSCRPNLLPDPLKPLSYSGALDDLRHLLNELGYDGKLFGEHSGKRGGSTQAVENGMDLETLKRLGGWRSSTMPAKYVDLAVKTRIEMSKKLQRL